MFSKNYDPLIPSDPLPKETYDPINGSVWIISIDIGGYISILRIPNIPPVFIENGITCMDLCFPEESSQTDEAGVYEATCNLVNETCPETGMSDGFYWEIDKMKLVYNVCKRKKG